MKDNGIKKDIKRFDVLRIIEHWIIAATFMVLVATGLSQKFYIFEASQWLVIKLGGIDAVRLIHRISGLFLTFLTLQHIVVASYGILFKRWRPVMIINKKDFTDSIDNMKYYLGLTDRPACCDRYNYKQKFEYWGILTGVLLMIMTGFILWFPMPVTGFLSGEIIPAAKALHTNEALLIFLVIAIWHIYNSIFSPDVFPLDTGILTGYVSRERMLREHPVELARMEGLRSEDICGQHDSER
ncbi:MAG: cytochrome b/b6 domain-containing protein [Nitrospirae bacterium]|nr:cytochrome b/b6 domain-containing protein [Nitrospirota bacterium]